VGFTDYEKDLKNPEVDLELILDKYFHCGESAVFHGAPPDEEPRLKEMVAAAILDTFGVRLHIFQLVVCGSAHLGFSPVPEKLGKPFDAKASDIDMAIASPELFDAWWTELQSAGLDMDTRQVVSRDLFWGFINPANVRHIKGYGSKWWALFGQLTELPSRPHATIFWPRSQAARRPCEPRGERAAQQADGAIAVCQDRRKAPQLINRYRQSEACE
jgi:hypothetical protein